MKFHLSDYKRFICNSLDNSQYISNFRAKKLLKETDEAIVEKIEAKDAEIQTIKEFLYTEKHGNVVLSLINSYEYDKYYKYFTLKLFDGDYNELLNKAKALTSNSEFCFNIFDCFEFRKFDSSFDIKFNIVKATHPQCADGQIYPVIITFLEGYNFLAIKYYAKPFQEFKDSFYTDIENSIIRWLGQNLDLKLSDHNSFRKLENIYASIEANPDLHKGTESIEVVKYEDENNGTTSFRANKDDKFCGIP